MPNLITDAWLPITRLSGAADTISPAHIPDQLSDDPVIDLAFDRPDFNAAVTEFLIGLLAVALFVRDQDVEKRTLEELWTELAPEDFSGLLAPMAPAFELLGDGPCAFQDYDPLLAKQPQPLDRLLIDAAGENTVKLNQDFFSSRHRESGNWLWSYTAAALITLQTYAPSGGAGHRTSMRGGGPLTTLRLPTREKDGVCFTALWDVLWANLPNIEDFDWPLLDRKTLAADPIVFPWVAPTLTSEKKQIVTPDDMHPLHVFFGMPRRIRLIANQNAITGYRTDAWGMNYETWQHPLSPYYEDKKGQRFPVHPKPGIPTYRDWPRYLGKGDLSAKSFAANLIRGWPYTPRMRACGYDMDNMKARAWVDVSVPLLADNEACIDAFLDPIVAGASEAGAALKLAMRRVLHGSVDEQDDSRPIKIDPKIKAETGASYATQLELATEPALRGLIEQWRSLEGTSAPTFDLKITWAETLRQAALAIFDRAADVTHADVQQLELIAKSRKALDIALSPFGKKPKMAAALGIRDVWLERRSAKGEAA